MAELSEEELKAVVDAVQKGSGEQRPRSAQRPLREIDLTERSGSVGSSMDTMNLIITGTVREHLLSFGDAAKGISACAACHGPAGAGMASAGFPAVYGQWTQYTTQQLQLFRDGVRINSMMNGVAVNMSDADMTAVASYIEGLR